MSFGKWSGKTFRNLLRLDRQYLEWIGKNTEAGLIGGQARLAAWAQERKRANDWEEQKRIAAAEAEVARAESLRMFMKRPLG